MDIDSSETSSREAVERLFHAISPVEVLYLAIDIGHYEPTTSRFPSPLDGLHPIFTTPHLRDLTISSDRVPLYLLEDLTDLRSFALECSQMVRIEDNQNGMWRSSTLEKLVVRYAVLVFNQIWAANLKYKNVGLAAFFDRLKYLDMDVHTSSMTGDTSWAILLARWRRLETLLVHWIVWQGEFLSIRYFSVARNTDRPHLLKADSSKMREPSQMIPWESFQALRSLTSRISHHIIPPMHEVDHQPSTLIFDGPSRLPNLQDFRVIYKNRQVLNEESLHLALHPVIYFRDLNKAMEDTKSFSNLKTFFMEPFCMLTLGDGPSLHDRDGDSGKLVQMVVDRLPAIFGVGGRKETCGWATSIVPTLRLVPFRFTVTS